MRPAALAAVLMLPNLAWADCATNLDLARAAISESGYRLVEAGTLSETGGRCGLTSLHLEQPGTLKVEIAAVDWFAAGFEAALAGASEPVSLDLRIRDARIVPQTADRWMSYYLDLQSRWNFIDARVRIAWDPKAGVIDVAELAVDLPGQNGFSVASRVTGATPDALPGRLTGFDALALNALTLEIENSGYLDGLVLGWMLGRFASVPGDPETVVAATLRELQGIVASWPDDIFPPDSKAALTTLIGAGPLPWGRLQIGISGDAISLDRLVALGLADTPFSPEAVAAAWGGAVFDIAFTPADPPE